MEIKRKFLYRLKINYRLIKRSCGDIKDSQALIYRQIKQWLSGAKEKYLFSRRPFDLVQLGNKKCHPCKQIADTEKGSKKDITEKHVYMYPHGLKGWFFLFWLVPSIALAFTLTSLVYSLSLILIYGAIMLCGYFYIYHVYNKPVLSDLWINWPKPYKSLIDDFFYPANMPVSQLPHGVRQRQVVALNIAMRQFFPKKEKYFLDKAIGLFILYWLTPIWLSYSALFFWFIVSYLSFQLEGANAVLAISPKELLLPIVFWWLISLSFIFKQSRFMDPKIWTIGEEGIRFFPDPTHHFLRQHTGSLNPKITFTKIVNIFHISIFGLYFLLLSFYASVWYGDISLEEKNPINIYAKNILD